jgi:hypothetical protein
MRSVTFLMALAAMALAGSAQGQPTAQTQTQTQAQLQAPALNHAPAQTGNCPADTFPALQTAFLASHGQTSAAAATMLLPAEGGARINFKQPMGTDTDGRTFRVFEVTGKNTSQLTFVEEDMVTAVEPADTTADGKFKTVDSTALTVTIPAKGPWDVRSFAVVACKGKDVSGWGTVTTHVSDPVTNIWICFGMGALIYGLSMVWIYRARQKPLPGDLTSKYPAIFGRKAFRWPPISPIHMIANAFNQASVQKAQVFLFSYLIGGLLLFLALSNGTLVDLSYTVVGLLGISGIGAATAQVAYQSKTRLSFDNWAWLQKRKALQIPDAEAPAWRDLVMTNREYDIYKLQTIIFTLVVAAEIVVGGASHLATFSVPPTLLGVLGLSQVVYVGGVMVKPPAVAGLDDAITQLRAAGETLSDAVNQGTDTDAAGKLLGTPASPPGVNARRQYNDQADRVEAMIESALEVPAVRANLDWQPDTPPTAAVAKPDAPPNGGPATPPPVVSAPQTVAPPVQDADPKAVAPPTTSTAGADPAATGDAVAKG